MGCGASTDTVAVAELQKQVKKLQHQLEKEKGKSEALKSTVGQGAAAEVVEAEQAAPELKKKGSEKKAASAKKAEPSQKAKSEASKESKDLQSNLSGSQGGNVHVTVADLVDKFVEDSGVKSQLAAAIIENLPPAAAAGDLEAAQTALRDTSKERFVEFTSTATERMADSMATKASELAERYKASKSAYDVNSKYAMEDGMIEGAFGNVDDFLKGVEGIGLPQPEPLKGMEMEFTHGPDAEDEFKTSNYGNKTTPIIEWDFITNPFTEESISATPTGPRSAWTPKHAFSGGRDPMRLRVLLYAVSAHGTNGLAYTDLEGAAKKDPADDLYLTAEECDLVKLSVLRFAKAQLDSRSLGLVLGEADDALVEAVRKRLKQALADSRRSGEDGRAQDAGRSSFAEVAAAVEALVSAPQLERLIAHFRARLAAAGLSDMEVMAMRLYTGPPFLKVNSVLRAWSGKFPAKMTSHLKGNKYINTIHVAVSGLTKLQKVCVIPAGRKAYRGMAGVLLPRVFWEADELRAKGGVDFGFMSTTTEKEVAIGYIPNNKQMPIIFEIELGCIDRGSSLSFLSQYPEEDEILFPPLSYLETTGQPYMEVTRKGDVIVMPARVNCNLKGKTVEEVAARRKEEHLSMREYLGKEMKRDLDALSELLRSKRLLTEEVSNDFATKKEQFELDYQKELEQYRSRDSTWFNRDDNYKRCITSGIDFKAGAIAELLAACKLPMHELAEGKAGELNDEEAAELMEGLLALGADTELKEESELKTLLHVACEESEPMAKLLIKYGADIEAKDQSYKQTPLLFAADKGNAAIAKELLEAGANLDAVDDSQYNAMHKAADGGDEGHVEVMRVIVERLKLAAGNALKTFINAKETSEWTPLMHACSGGHLAAAKFLLDNGADIAATDDDKRTALHHAAEDTGDENVALVELLLSRKADPNKADKDKNLPLHSCANCGNEKVLKVLLDLDPKRLINLKGERGQTPLHMAANHSPMMVQLLLEMGADEKIKDREGKLASKIAKESDEKKIHKMLKAKESGGDWTQFKKKPEDGSNASGDDDDDDDDEEEEEEEEEAGGEDDLDAGDSDDDW